MTVVLLLALIWAVVLVPPAIRSHAERRKAFLVSFGQPPVDVPLPSRRPSPHIRRRRRIAGGLLVAMAATLLVGLLPPFRALLVVHLFLVDSFLAYIGLLAYRADHRWGRAPVAHPAPAPVVAGPVRRWRRPEPASLAPGAAPI